MIEQEELETTGHFVQLRRRQDCRASILATQLFHIDSTGHRGPYKSVLETTIQAMLEKSLDGEFEDVKKRREWS